MILLPVFFSMLNMVSNAFLLKPATIVQKTVENNGHGVYAIEQEVQFSAGAETFAVRENWLIENENKMRVLITGSKELKDKIHLLYVYENGQRLQSVENHRKSQALESDFIEKYFHFRHSENLENALVEMQIMPAAAFAKKAKTDKEPNLRLARVGGVIVYEFGTVALNSKNPAFFIEQDQFLLRKFRLPSEVEVTAERFSNYAHGLDFPSVRTVRWNDKQVVIQTVHVQARPEKSISLNLEESTNLSDLHLGGAQSALQSTIEEFYQRFR